jgi:hypothetical protein
MLSCFKFLKEFWRVFCFFVQNPWHFVFMRTEADDFLFSFRGERTVGFMFYGDEMSWYFRVASLRDCRISIFRERIFHRNFILRLQNGRVFIFGEGRCCHVLNFWKNFYAFSAISDKIRDSLPENWSRRFFFLFSGGKDLRLFVLRRWDVVVFSCC